MQRVRLDTTLVYKAFKLPFINKVKANKGTWVHVEVKRHQEVASESQINALSAEVKYRSHARLKMCVAGSLASAVSHAGDKRAADAIAQHARASIASMDAVKLIKKVVNSSMVAGWHVQPLPQSPLKSIYPCMLHIEGRDPSGKVDRSHAITVMDGMILDANHSHARARAPHECCELGCVCSRRRLQI